MQSASAVMLYYDPLFNDRVLRTLGTILSRGTAGAHWRVRYMEEFYVRLYIHTTRSK